MENDKNFSANQPAATISCPECGCVISYVDRRKSAFFSCPQCATYFTSSLGARQALRKFNRTDEYGPSIPLGTQGIVDGQEYILVGFMTKKEAGSDTYWDEYAFFSPGDQWYLMLAEFDGHWMIITRSDNQFIDEQQAIGGKNFAYEHGVPYELYLSYQFTVVDAVGEFDWDILSDEELTTFEYVSAPNILVNEQRNGKPGWFRARYINPRELMGLFGVSPELFPPRSGLAAFNPATFYPRWRPLMGFTGVMLGLVLLLHLVLYASKPARDVYAGSFPCIPDTTAPGACRPLVTPPFTINGPAPVSFHLGCDQLNNQWMEVPVALINDNNGKVYEVDKTIEYYLGYEDGESWKEGAREQDAIVSGVPSGTYHLNIYPALEDKPQPVQLSLDIKITQNVFLSLNFWLFITALLIWPLIQLIRKYSFENSRWFDKDYGTYNKDN